MDVIGECAKGCKRRNGRAREAAERGRIREVLLAAHFCLILWAYLIELSCWDFLKENNHHPKRKRETEKICWHTRARIHMLLYTSKMNRNNEERQTGQTTVRVFEFKLRENNLNTISFNRKLKFFWWRWRCCCFDIIVYVDVYVSLPSAAFLRETDWLFFFPQFEFASCEYRMKKMPFSAHSKCNKWTNERHGCSTVIVHDCSNYRLTKNKQLRKRLKSFSFTKCSK